MSVSLYFLNSLGLAALSLQLVCWTPSQPGLPAGRPHILISPRWLNPELSAWRFARSCAATPVNLPVVDTTVAFRLTVPDSALLLPPQ